MTLLRILIGLPTLALFIGVLWAIGHRMEGHTANWDSKIGLGFLVIIVFAVIIGLLSLAAWAASFIFWH